MKKIFSILAVILLLTSCENDVKTNTPSFQGNKDNVFWKASDSRVTLNNDGTITINAYTEYEVVSIKVPNSPGTYTLTPTSSSYATYTYSQGGKSLQYNTAKGKGNGTIVLKPSEAPGTFSGTFKFNAENENGLILNYNKGVFYKVPVY